MLYSEDNFDTKSKKKHSNIYAQNTMNHSDSVIVSYDVKIPITIDDV